MKYQPLAMASAIAASLALTACGGGKGGGQQQPPLNVDVATATRQNLATFVTLDGQCAPLLQSTLTFQQSGPIARVTVNVGDRVSQGELLAQIDPSTLQAQLAAAEAQASQAGASARGAQLGLPAQQQNNQSALATAQASLANAKLNYNQDQTLYKQGYVSQQQLEATRAAYQQAQSQYNAASTGLANNQVAAQNVRASQAQASAAAAQANVLRTQLGQTALYAPFNGVVTARYMDPGGMAGPGSQVLQVARIDTVWINVNVPDEDLQYVHAGLPVTFTSSSLPGKSFAARVDSVNATPTAGTLSYLARLQVPNPGNTLRGGMLVNVTVPQAKRTATIVVPRSAVATNDQGSSVFVITADQKGATKAEQVPVKVGLQTDTLAEVISPRVQQGTKVITTRPDALQNGSVVAIANGPGGSKQPANGGGAQ